MSNLKIVADSSADLTALQGVNFDFAPLKIVTNEKEYVDDINIDVAQMSEELYRYKGRSSTSCPNADDWLNAFGDAENIICFTITSGLSGSYNSACSAKKIYTEEHTERRVEVVDTLSAGPEITLMVEKAAELVREGKSMDEVMNALSEYKTELSFILCSLRNFANNGRVSKVTAAAIGVLGIRVLGRASDGGTLEVISKSRGAESAFDSLITQMTERGYKGGRVIISHSFNENGAVRLSEKIKTAFPSAAVDVRILRGLCSFYAEKGGILIGYEI